VVRSAAIVGLVWDDEDDPEGNVAHIARHGLTPWEVRQALLRARLFIATANPEGPNPVYVAVGPTVSGKLLEIWGIHFQAPPLQGFWRTVTALPARPYFRQQYECAEEEEADVDGGPHPQDRESGRGDGPPR
jgi:hypothetical protein